MEQDIIRIINYVLSCKDCKELYNPGHWNIVEDNAIQHTVYIRPVYVDLNGPTPRVKWEIGKPEKYIGIKLISNKIQIYGSHTKSITILLDDGIPDDKFYHVLSTGLSPITIRLINILYNILYRSYF